MCVRGGVLRSPPSGVRWAPLLTLRPWGGCVLPADTTGMGTHNGTLGTGKTNIPETALGGGPRPCALGVEFSLSVWTMAIAVSGMSTCRSAAGRHQEDPAVSFPWRTASKDCDQDRSPFLYFPS